MNKNNRAGYFIKEGISSIFTHGFMSFASVTIIIACLLIMGTFALLTININAMLSGLEDKNQMLAFVDEELSIEEARALQRSVNAIPNVSEAHFVTREEALESFKKQYEDSGLFDTVSASIFRHRYIIFMDDISLMADTQKALLGVEGIVKVNAHLEISRGFIMARRIINIVSLTLVTILLLISFFIMANTVKLTTFDRREEIAIMKMVGATNSFIRWPFVVEGIVLGLTGSLLAFLLQWGLYELITSQISTNGILEFIVVIPFINMAVQIVAIFVATGLVVGVCGSLMAIKNYLRV